MLCYEGGEEGKRGYCIQICRVGCQGASRRPANGREQHGTVRDSMCQVSTVTVLPSPRWFGPQTEQITPNNSKAGGEWQIAANWGKLGQIVVEYRSKFHEISTTTN